MRESDPAGAEDQIDPPVRIDGADDAGRELGVLLASERPRRERRCTRRFSRFEPADADQRVVVTFHGECARAMTEDLNLAVSSVSTHTTASVSET